MGAKSSHVAGDYQEPELPEGVLEVRLSIYKLGMTGSGFFDSIASGVVGAYHTGFVVSGVEWAFGGHDVDFESGVYRCDPEKNPQFLFYQRLVLGRITARPLDLEQQINELAFSEDWLGTRYDIFERNCNHFASDLCWRLVKLRPPDWINATAMGMGLSRRRSKLEEQVLRHALETYRRQHMQKAGADDDDVPGVLAFVDAFKGTFELRWARGRKEIRRISEACPEGEDPQQVRIVAESEQLELSAQAAHAAALVAAMAARQAALARASSPPHVDLAVWAEAWDDAWGDASAGLLKAWRNEAAADNLDPDATSQQGLERTQTIKAALNRATRAAFATVQSQEGGVSGPT